MHHTPPRRTFMMSIVATGALLTVARAHAQTPASVDDADPQATALGYYLDTTKVDAAKYPKHEVAQNCAGCQLFQGKTKDAKGPCTLFAGKLVTPNGWCSAWLKKTA